MAKRKTPSAYVGAHGAMFGLLGLAVLVWYLRRETTLPIRGQ